jgi:hypothetical protein
MELHRAHLLELAYPALNLSGLAGFGAKAADELFEVLLFLLEVLRCVFEKLALLLALQEIPFVVSAERADALGLEAHDAVDLLVEELPVVGDQKERLVVAAQKLRKPGYRGRSRPGF